MRIKKVSQTAGLVGSIVNTQSESNKDTYSCDYINNILKPVGVLLGKFEPVSHSGSITLTQSIYNFKNIVLKLYNNESPARIALTTIPVPILVENEPYFVGASWGGGSSFMSFLVYFYDSNMAGIYGYNYSGWSAVKCEIYGIND